MNVGILARKSTDAQASSVERQVEDARRYAAAMGWTVVDVCIFAFDEGVSGTLTNSPQILAALAEGKRRPKRIEALIVQAPDRITRDMVGLQVVLGKLNEAGLRVFCYADGSELKTDTLMGQLIVALQGFAGAHEREKIIGRTSEALSYRARAGHVTGGRLYGYRNVRRPDGGKGFVDREIVDDEANWVRWIFERYADGDGFRGIASELNVLGVETPRGKGKGAKLWQPGTIRPILLNELYRGVQVYGQKKKVIRDGRKAVVDGDPAQISRTDVPQLRIVTEELWLRVQAAMASRTKKRGEPTGRSPSAILVGNLFCAVCGSRMYVTGSEKSYSCGGRHLTGAHTCTNTTRRPIASVDDAFVSAVLQALDVETLIDLAVAEQQAMMAPNPDADMALDALRRRRETLSSEIENLATAIASAANGPTIARLVTMLEERQARLEAVVAEAAGREKTRAAAPLDVADLRKRAREAIESLSAALRGDVKAGRDTLRETMEGKAKAIPILVNGQRRFLIRGSL